MDQRGPDFFVNTEIHSIDMGKFFHKCKISAKMNILIAILVLGFLILFHELGHFLFARLFGVKVEVFSIGFGPKIFSFRIGETEYAISAIPFGGYVKMAGDDPDKLEGADYEFLSKPVYQKILIVLAGPLFNIILGFFAFFISIKFYGLANITNPTVYKSEVEDLQRGDVVIRVEGEPFKGWYFIYRDNAKSDTHLDIVRGSDTLSVVLEKGEAAKVEPVIDPIIGKVIPGTPAAEAGLKAGDRIVAVDGKPITSWQEFVEYVRERPGKHITITVERNGQLLNFDLEVGEEVGPDGKKRGIVGVVVKTDYYYPPFPEALKLAWERTIRSSILIFVAFYDLITGKASIQGIGGPVMIGKVLGESANVGMRMLLDITGLISINLAIINLIPFPGLDGGHILIFLIEAITRRRIDPKLYFAIQLIGIMILLALAVAITVFDIWRILHF